MYSQESDSIIWRDFKAGDICAYEFIYKSYLPVLYNYGFKICSNKVLTQDCIQELFITLLEKKDTLSENVSIKFYLFKSLRRRLIREIAKDNKFGNIDDELSFDSEFLIEDQLDADMSQEHTKQLSELLNHLPPRQKEAITLRFYDNLSYEEIAKIMDIEVSSVYKIIYKSLDNLQKRMVYEFAMLLVFSSPYFYKN